LTKSDIVNAKVQNLHEAQVMLEMLKEENSFLRKNIMFFELNDLKNMLRKRKIVPVAKLGSRPFW
jgi:hypothetical protein